MIKGDFAINMDIVARGRRFLLEVAGQVLSCVINMVAFLRCRRLMAISQNEAV